MSEDQEQGQATVSLVTRYTRKKDVVEVVRRASAGEQVLTVRGLIDAQEGDYVVKLAEKRVVTVHRGAVGDQPASDTVEEQDQFDLIEAADFEANFEPAD